MRVELKEKERWKIWYHHTLYQVPTLGAYIYIILYMFLRLCDFSMIMVHMMV